MNKIKESNLNVALAYTQMLGWKIFPVKYKSKVPATQNGFKDASNNEGQIKLWWTDNPNYNLGLPTGKINNIVVLDIDPRNGGQLSFERLIDENESLPHTVESFTGGGGRHIYFKYDDRISKSSLQGCPGIDIQSDGKYILLPSSIHPNGKEYLFEQSSKPIITEIAEMPNWLIEMLSVREEVKHEKKSSSFWIDLFNNTSAGNRNNAAAKMAGSLFRRYVDPKLVVEIMHLWNTEKVNPPLDSEELNKIINSIARTEFERRSRR